MGARRFYWTLAILLAAPTPAFGCTTLLVGKSATVDGSVMATHSNDGGGTTDPRLVRIPARDWPAGSTRPIWPNPESYPRFVGGGSAVGNRGAPSYDPKPGQLPSVPLGFVDQVNHTYAYFEQTYGTLNEKQLGMGESTCSAVYAAMGLDEGGAALWSIDELSRVAMERASSARDAVQLMGDLAVSGGFHGQSGALEGGGESLMVIDPDEGFVFHILADKSGTSAIWVAQRVPDDSMAVVRFCCIPPHLTQVKVKASKANQNLFDLTI
jgi:dipeptidase